MNASSSDLEICLSLLVCKLLLNGSTLKLFAQLEKPHSGQYLVSLLRLILGRHLRRNAELIVWQDGQHVVRPFSTTHGRRGRHGGERHLPVRQLLLPFHELGYMLRRSVELCLNNRTSNVTKLILSSQELPARIISVLGDRLRKFYSPKPTGMIWNAQIQIFTIACLAVSLMLMASHFSRAAARWSLRRTMR